MDSKTLATIIAVAKKESLGYLSDFSKLEAKIEGKLKALNKESPITETPDFVMNNGCLYCTWSSGRSANLGNVRGRDGEDGTDGVDGIDGLPGVNGTNGSDGAPGDSGDKGDRGLEGNRGPQGLRGSKGPVGLQGAKGIPSLPGLDGLDGLKGIDGLDGDDGVGVEKAWIDDKYHLTLRLDSGKVMDAGYVRGPAGASGAGKGGRVTGNYIGGGSGSNPTVTGASYNEDNELIIINSNGSSVNAGPPKEPRSAIYVREASQLSGVLDSTILYIIDGHIDMGTQHIVVPIGGLNVAGLSLNTSSLYSLADNYTMFQCVPLVGCGNFSLGFLGIKVSGTNSSVFSLDNLEQGGRIGWKSVNFNSCTSLGTIKSYSQALAQNVSWRDCLDGLTCDGVWGGGWAILNSIILGDDFEGTLFKAGDTLSIGGSFRSNINLLKLDVDNGIFCDFSPSNIVLDAGFALSNVRVNPLADALPNMPSTSVKVLIKDCVGIGDTYAGAAHQPQSDSVITIAEAGTLYQITGAVDLSESYWFSTSNTNGLRLDSSLPIQVTTSGTMSFSGGSNTEMSVQMRKFVSSSSSYLNIGPEYTTTFSTSAVFGTLASNVSFSATTEMKLNDRIEVWVKNNTNTDDITSKAGGQFQVTER